MIAPCKDCNDRYYACHDSCPKYQEFRAWKDEDNAKKKKSWQVERIEYTKTRKDRIRKR